MIANLGNKIKRIYIGDTVKENGLFIPRDELDRMYGELIALSKKLMKKDMLDSARERIGVAEFIVDLEKRYEGML